MPARIPSPVAHLTDDDNHVVHGVAIGEGDRTNGAHGRKAWPREVLEPAAESLTGQTIWFNEADPSKHGDSGRQNVGTVTQSAYEPGVGVVYEAELTDEKVAKKLSSGQLDVSIEAANADRIEHDETGASILHGFDFTGMAAVEKGASPSNYTAPGEAEANPGIAALSADEIAAALDGKETRAKRLAQQLAAQEERLAVLRKQREILEEKRADLAEQVEELEQVKGEVDHMKEIYAAALSDDEMFTAEELVEKFTVDELRTKVGVSHDDTPEIGGEPDVQTGGGPTATAALSRRSLDSDEREKAKEIKRRIKYWSGKNDTIVAAEKEKLAELTGVSADNIDIE